MKFIKTIVNQVKAAIRRKKIADRIVKSVEMQVTKRNRNGSKAYGFKLVPRSNRKARRAYGKI